MQNRTMGMVDKTATNWLVTRFLDASADDSFTVLVEKHFPDDEAMCQLARIARGADAPEQFDVMPESAGLRLLVHGFAAEGIDESRVAKMYDALLAALRERVERGEPLESSPLLDPVSGLPNRLLFLDRLDQAIAYARRHDTLLAVCSIRFDLEPVASHVDRVSREIADRLHHTIRELDTIARLGTAEFGVVLNDLRARASADVALAKIGETLSQPFDIVDRSYEIARYIGISFYPAHGHDAAMLLDAARQAADVAVPVSVFGES